MGFDFDLIIILEMFDGFKRRINPLLTLLSWGPFEAV